MNNKDNLITYKGTIEKDRFIKVCLNGKKVGSIMCLDGKNYQYLPKDIDVKLSEQEKFLSLDELKARLESV